MPHPHGPNGVGSLPQRKVNANQLLIIPRETAMVGKRRMRPDNGAAAVLVGGIEQMSPAEFFVTRRVEFSDDQISFLVKKKETPAVFDNERIGPAHRFA